MLLLLLLLCLRQMCNSILLTLVHRTSHQSKKTSTCKALHPQREPRVGLMLKKHLNHQVLTTVMAKLRPTPRPLCGAPTVGDALLKGWLMQP